MKTWCTAFWLKVLLLNAQLFHTKLICQKLMLKQIEWGAQNGPITKNEDLPRTTYFFKNLVLVQEPLINSRFNVPISKMRIFIRFVSALVLFDRVFFL